LIGFSVMVIWLKNCFKLILNQVQTTHVICCFLSCNFTDVQLRISPFPELIIQFTVNPLMRIVICEPFNGPFLSHLGLIHTRHFCTQYCDKKTFENIFKLGFNKHNCPKINIFNTHKKYWIKNIFLSQYLFIAILCLKMSSV